MQPIQFIEFVWRDPHILCLTSIGANIPFLFLLESLKLILNQILVIARLTNSVIQRSK